MYSLFRSLNRKQKNSDRSLLAINRNSHLSTPSNPETSYWIARAKVNLLFYLRTDGGEEDCHVSIHKATIAI